MFPSMLLFNPFQKGFVRAHTRKGKQVGPYFTTRQKKIGTVKHTKKTRVDYSEKEAQLKIKLLNEKKKHHNLHVEAAKELKEKVDSHKSKGNTTFKIGTKEHDISKVTKDLNNHIEHHSNEVKSHDNHISKIQDRHKTDREYFENKRVKKAAKKPSEPKLKIEKEGRKYDIYWPSTKGDGQQKSIKGVTLKEAKNFVEKWKGFGFEANFEGLHLLDPPKKTKPETVERIQYAPSSSKYFKYNLKESILKTHFKELMKLSHPYDSKTKTGFIQEANKEAFLKLVDKMNSSNLKRSKTSHKSSIDKLRERKGRISQDVSFSEWYNNIADIPEKIEGEWVDVGTGIPFSGRPPKSAMERIINS